MAGTLTQTGIPAGRTELTLKLKSKAKKALQKGPKTASYRARIKAKGELRRRPPPVSRSAQVTLEAVARFTGPGRAAAGRRG